ncbi:MAG: ABC transporter substrate-binding protein [Dehalococcoidia bacterium]|nr:MAG: ABC transporter substrate-binding protein [Dehalococcoidia bacterium]
MNPSLPRSLPLLALIVAVACQPSAPAPASTTTGSSAPAQPTGPSGKLTVALAQPLITSLDTGFGNDAQTLQFMWPYADGLTWISADGKVNPGLAKEWRTVNDTTWEFTLGDFKFHNGRAVEAQDVVDTYARYQDPDKKLPARVIFTGAGISSTSAPNAKTVRITTSKPNPTIPNILQLAMILPMKELNVVGDVEFFRKPIGSGPFRVEAGEFNAALRYSAMGPDFPTPRGTPKIKDLEIRVVPEISSRLAALRTGDVDLALALVADNVPTLEQNGFKVFQTRGTATAHFSLDLYNGPTTNLKVRQAINHAVDKEVVARVFYGGRARVDTAQLIGPDVLGYNPSLQPYAYDVAKARQLLAEAGYPNGFKIPMTMINLSTINKDLAQIVADQLKQVGIEVEIQIKETAIWLQDYYGPPERRPGMFVQVINWDQTFEPDSVYRWYSSDTTVDGGRRWTDETFDRQYQAAHSELDRTRRGQLYQTAAKTLSDAAVALFGWQVFGVFGGKRNVEVGQPGHADFYVQARVS